MMTSGEGSWVRWGVRAVVVAAVGVVSCGTDAAKSAPGPVCSPGKQDACACGGGVTGYQRCKDDGSGWEACVCPDAGEQEEAGEAGGGGAAGAAGGCDDGGSIEDASADGSGGFGGTGLDPLLVPGDQDARVCMVDLEWWVTGCNNPAFSWCRIDSPDGGRCETADCYDYQCPAGSPCEVGRDCAPLYQCYGGQCRAICKLGSQCDSGLDCQNVGHVTHGICVP